MSYQRMVFLSGLLLLVSISFAQQRDVSFYESIAFENHPTLKENIALKEYYLLQNQLTLIPLQKPQVNITGDLLFAPFFFNNGHFISVTNQPESNAYGYDVGLSNGGLYAAQLNASVPLFTNKLTGIYGSQAALQNRLLDNHNVKLRHEIEKTVIDQYVNVFVLQEQIIYEQKIISLVENRKEIISALVLKGLMQQNDFLLLDIEIKQRQYDIEQMQVSLAAAFQQLNNACAISDTTIYTLTSPSVARQPIKNVNQYQLQFELDSAKIVADENIFNLKYRPQLNAFGNAGINSSSAAHIPHDIGFSAGLHVDIPLYDGGQRKLVEQQNKILRNNLKLCQQQNSILIKNNLASLDQQISLTEKSIRLLDVKLSSQETLLQIIRDKVITGQVSVTDYLNALQDYAATSQLKIQDRASLLLLINQYNYENW